MLSICEEKYIECKHYQVALISFLIFRLKLCDNISFDRTAAVYNNSVSHN